MSNQIRKEDLSENGINQTIRTAFESCDFSNLELTVQIRQIKSNDYPKVIVTSATDQNSHFQLVFKRKVSIEIQELDVIHIDQLKIPLDDNNDLKKYIVAIEYTIIGNPGVNLAENSEDANEYFKKCLDEFEAPSRPDYNFLDDPNQQQSQQNQPQIQQNQIFQPKPPNQQPQAKPQNNHFQSQQQSHQQSRPTQIQKRNGAQRFQGVIYHPLELLDTFSVNVTVKVKILNAETKDITKKNGDPLKILNVRFMDEDRTEMEGVAFGENAEKFSPMFEVDKIYEIRNPSIELNSNRNYTAVNNEHRLKFVKMTVITPLNVPFKASEPNLNIFPIKDIIPLSNDNVIDICGVVLTSNEWSTIISKKNDKEHRKKEVTIGDHSEYSVLVTFWADENTNEERFNNINPGDVVLIKKLKITTFHSKQLKSIGTNTLIIKDPEENEHSEIQKLYNFLRNNNYENFQFQQFPTEGDVYTEVYPTNITKLKSYLDALETKSDEGFLPMKKFLIRMNPNINEQSYYDCCPKESCKKKKVVPSTDGFLCNKCGNVYSTPGTAYKLNVMISDDTQATYVDFFVIIAEN